MARTHGRGTLDRSHRRLPRLAGNAGVAACSDRSRHTVAIGASAFRLSAQLFRVTVAGPFGLPVYRGTGSAREESGSTARDANDYFFRGGGRSRTQMAVAALLALLFVGHVGVFGWRSVTFDRRITGDSMNYIDVARNLSAW